MELQSISAFKKFAITYGTHLKALYPCCGFDDSPSRVFSDVLLVDKNELAIKAMKGKGLNAVAADVMQLDYSCDLLILINPSIKADLLVSRFKPQFVICNNLHGTAEEISKLNYKLVEMLGVDYWLFKI